MDGSKKPVDPLLQTHYEVLDLLPDCTFKEVRTAFLVKSKQTHPDLHPGDPSRHEAFLRLRQAYAVLSRPQDRQLYDLTLMQQRHAAQARAAPWVDTNAPPGTVHGWHDESLWSMRDPTKDRPGAESRPYYGIRGLNRVRNSTIALGCMAFMLAGACLHYFVIRASTDAALKTLNERDRDSSAWYAETRRKATGSTNRVQLQKMRLGRHFNSADAEPAPKS